MVAPRVKRAFEGYHQSCTGTLTGGTRLDRTYPLRYVPDLTAQERTCLKCAGRFTAYGKFNRVCFACSKTNQDEFTGRQVRVRK